MSEWKSVAVKVAAVAVVASVAYRTLLQTERTHPSDVPTVMKSTTRTEGMTALLGNNVGLLTPSKLALVRSLLQQDQGHMFKQWPARGTQDEDKKRFLDQLVTVDKSLPGGLCAYLTRARALLKTSKTNGNPFAGWTPSVPKGCKLTTSPTGQAEFDAMDARGVVEATHSVFVIVAGGLGERLGYDGIKVELPVDVTTEHCYLERYCRYILALQSRAEGDTMIPLVIMTSDDTHSKTVDLLRRCDNFGMSPKQISLIKQEKVPALADNEAHVAMDPSDPFAMVTKPHGHGDVHGLLHTSGIANAWIKQGKKWVVFFQDTNGLVFTVIPAAIGVSATHDMAVNSLAVERRPGEAVGAITRMTADDGRAMTINVEYNQFDPVMKASKVVDECDDRGFSSYPGNINTLVFRCPDYVTTLQRTKGIIAEFVNPKYTDETKTTFRKPTRLECMMQDYPKALGAEDVVGFSQFARDTYSPVKNNVVDAAKQQKAGRMPSAASTGEADMYRYGRKVLHHCGVEIEVDTSDFKMYHGLKVPLGARVVLLPSFALTHAEARAKIQGKVRISKRSTLILEGEGIVLGDLVLDGALVVRAPPGTKVLVSGEFHNKGWEFHDVVPGDAAQYHLRGYRLLKHEAHEIISDPHSTDGTPENARLVVGNHTAAL